MSFTKEQLDNWFTYHAPTEKTAPKYAAIREAEESAHIILRDLRANPDNAAGWSYADINRTCRKFAEVIDANCPDSADKSAAIRCVRLARNALNEYLTATKAPIDVEGVLNIATDQARMARWQANSAIACGGK